MLFTLILLMVRIRVIIVVFSKTFMHTAYNFIRFSLDVD